MTPAATTSRGALDRLQIAALLREIGMRLRLAEGRSFSGRAYENAARSLQLLDLDLDLLVRETRLEEIPGVGPAIARDIAQLALEGRSERLERLRGELPSAVLEMSRVPGVGLAKARRLFELGGIGSVPELEAACRAESVRELAGFGPATERRILEGIEQHRERSVRAPLSVVLDLAELLVAHLREHRATIRAELAGEIRRWAASVDAISIVAATEDPPSLVERLLAHPMVARVSWRRRDACRARLATGLPVTLDTSVPERFGWLWLRATGPAAHVAELETLAERAGLALEDLEADTEEAVYAALDVPEVPPEPRGVAVLGESFHDLLTEQDVRGLLHCHSDWSDGRHGIEELARAAEELGFSYLTITDHSRSAHYAGGLEIDRLESQWREIDRVRERVRIRILRGAEVDVLRDGELDYPDEVLSRLEVVIASLHSALRLDEDAQTARLIRALRHPCFKILGHPLARIVQHRPPIACRVEEVLDAAAVSAAAVEVNGDPRRLDLPAEWIPAVRARGIPLVVSTDAHSTRGFGHLRWAVATARRGGARRNDVLNTLEAERFARTVRPRR